MKKLNITLASAVLTAIVYAGCANVLDNRMTASASTLHTEEIALDKNAGTIFSGNNTKEDVIILKPD